MRRIEIIRDYAFDTCEKLEETTFPTTLTALFYERFFIGKITFLANAGIEGRVNKSVSVANDEICEKPHSYVIFIIK